MLCLFVCWTDKFLRFFSRERGTKITAMFLTITGNICVISGHGLAAVIDFIKAEYNRRSQLKPLLWDSTIQLPIEDVYTRLKIVSRRKRDFKLENNEVNMYDIYKNKDVIALVEGSPGIGKTTFCLKIAYDWANEKIPEEYSFPEFEIVLLLKCRDIDGDIMKTIDEQLLPQDMYEYFRKELMDYLRDFRYQEKVLIILDGLDELPKKSESHVDRLLHKKILPYCYVLVTSRQEKGIVVRQRVNFDILLQIEGFTEEDAFDYIRKHFRNAGSEHLPTGERLIEEIQENSFLHALLNNPLNLLLLCVVFEDYQGKLPSFRTELYQIIVRCLLRRYCAKHNLEAPDDDKALEKQFEESLLALGELAWRCLQEDRHSFREEELARFERNNKDLAARKLGLVFKEASVKRIKPQHEYHFFHKTFQEYLAASYLAHKLLKEEVNVFRDLELKVYKHIVKEYRQVFLFVCGILGEDACILFGQIGKILESDDWDWFKCSPIVATFFTESFNECRNAELVAATLCSFIPFPLTLNMDETTVNTNIFTVANACKNFSQVQHPVHLTVARMDELRDSDINAVADFLASCPQLETLNITYPLYPFTLEQTTALFKGLSENSSLSSFTLNTKSSISSREAVVIGDSLAENETLRTVTFELRDEWGEAWASALATVLCADTPVASIVLKIYGSMSDTAIRALKNVFSNRSLTSLALIIYGEMTDSQATAVGEGLAAQTILESLTLIVYGKLSYSGAISLKTGFLENSSLNSLEVKVFGELPDNWVTITEYVLTAKRSFMSVTVHPNVIGNITNAKVVCLCPLHELQSLTLNVWGELSGNGAETLCELLKESSTSCVSLNIHGRVTDDVADCFLRHFKLCKTLSSLSINILGELTRDGNSALQELSCNQRCSFTLIAPTSTSDDWISKDLKYSTTDVSLSSTSVLTKLKDSSKSMLSFDITNNGDMSGILARALSDCLAKNMSLTTLSLTFNNYSIMSEDWGRSLSDGLAKNMSLTTLSLSFNNYSDMTGGWACLGDGLAKNTSLTTLSLTLNNYSVVHGDWACLGDGLAKNTSLTTLWLAFNNYRIMSGVWIHDLSNGFAQNTSLTTLCLTCTFSSFGTMSGDWGRGLGYSLAQNVSLTTLSLTLNGYSVMSRDLMHDLSDGLAKNTSLITLSLTFYNYSVISGDWARGLGDGLAKNTSLTTLSLTFDNYSAMLRDWGPGLGDVLAKTTSLTTVNLTLSNYGDMSGDWASGVGDGLAKNTSLTTLSLTFNSYRDISGDWGHGLGDGLAKNKSLNTLSLTCNAYSGTSGDWLNNLCDSLAKSDTITSLSLTINDHSDASKLLGSDLSKRLSNCKSLTSFNLTVSLYGEPIVC